MAYYVSSVNESNRGGLDALDLTIQTDPERFEQVVSSKVETK